jgi:hypothetical protein
MKESAPSSFLRWRIKPVHSSNQSVTEMQVGAKDSGPKMTLQQFKIQMSLSRGAL